MYIILILGKLVRVELTIRVYINKTS